MKRLIFALLTILIIENIQAQKITKNSIQCFISDLEYMILPCNSNTNTYSLFFPVNFNNAPANGTLVVVLGEDTLKLDFNPESKFKNIRIDDLIADGESLNLRVFFSENPSCFAETEINDVPESCGGCKITKVELDCIECNKDNNTFSQTLSISYEFPPDSAILVVNGREFPVTQNSKTTTITLDGLVANGGITDLDIQFKEIPECELTVLPIIRSPRNCRRANLVNSFTLIDAPTGEPIPEFDPIPNGAVIYIDSLPSDQISIRANTSPDSIGSLVFLLNRENEFIFERIENIPEYALFGNDERSYNPWPNRLFSLNKEYHLEAIPFREEFGRGRQDISKRISFTFKRLNDLQIIESEDTENNKLLIYPNPAEKTIKLSFQDKKISKANKRIEIYDRLGNKFLDKAYSIQGDITINLDEKIKDHCIVKVIVNGQSFHKRVLIR